MMCGRKSNKLADLYIFDSDDDFDQCEDSMTSRYLEGKGSLFFRRGRFINSNFSFIMKSHVNYEDNIRDPDSEILWLNVVLVISRSTGKISCPICLTEMFIVPRVSWCGHIFCHPCMIRYFESPGSNPKRCPVCQDVMYLHEMKPISINNFPFLSTKPTPDNPQTVAMCLLKKTKGLSIALPVKSYDQWLKSTNGKSLPLASDYDALKFAKLMSEPYTDYYLDILQDDLNELLSYVSSSNEYGDTDTQNSGHEKLENLDHSSIEKSISCLISQISSFQRSSENTKHTLYSSRLSLSKINSILSDNVNMGVVNETLHTTSQENPDTQLFYQCATGETLFLRSLDNTIIRTQKDEKSQHLPLYINLLVYHVTYLTLVGANRRMYRYLDHLSSCSEVGLCDTELIYTPQEHLHKSIRRKLQIRKHQLKTLTIIYLEKLANSQGDITNTSQQLDISLSPNSFTEYTIPYSDLDTPPPLDVIHEWPEVGSVYRKTDDQDTLQSRKV